MPVLGWAHRLHRLLAPDLLRPPWQIQLYPPGEAAAGRSWAPVTGRAIVGTISSGRERPADLPAEVGGPISPNSHAHWSRLIRPQSCAGVPWFKRRLYKSGEVRNLRNLSGQHASEVLRAGQKVLQSASEGSRGR